LLILLSAFFYDQFLGKITADGIHGLLARNLFLYLVLLGKFLKSTYDDIAMITQKLEQNMQFPLNMGKSSSFEQVYMTYFHALRFFISRTISIDDAEDILEDLFARLWNKKPTFENEIHLKGFLYRAADNARKDFLKSHRISRTDYLENQNLMEVENYNTDQIKSEVYGELYRAINNLPSQCRTIISLSYIEGLNNKEIADQLGLSEQSVKNTKVRAIKILKQELPFKIVVILLSAIN